jgi:hypothetical protein
MAATSPSNATTVGASATRGKGRDQNRTLGIRGQTRKYRVIDPSSVHVFRLPRNPFEMELEARYDAQTWVVVRRCGTTNSMGPETK